jgi:hypothetical protein
LAGTQIFGVRRLCECARIAVAITPGNNGEPAPPPRPACASRYGRAGAPRRRAPRRDTAALPALDMPGPCSASHAASGDHHSERRDQPKLTVCTGGKSHPQNPRNHGVGRPHTDSGTSVTGSEERTSCLIRRPCTVSAPGRSKAMPAALTGDGALSEWESGTSRRCRCGTLLLYQAPDLLGSGFRIMAVNCSGAMGIRTPDLLHAIQRQPVHSSPSPQVTVPESAPTSACVQACCGTFLLYGPARQAEAKSPCASPRPEHSPSQTSVTSLTRWPVIVAIVW